MDKLEVTYEGTSQVKKSKFGIEAKVIAIEEAKNIETLALDKLIGSFLTHEMRPNKGAKKEKVMKKKVGITLKSIINEYSESSEKVDEEKEMQMFSRRFERFMKSNKGRRFQKSLSLPSRKISLFVMSARNRKTSSLIFLNGRRSLANKNTRPILLLGVMRIHPMMKIKK
ncbi:hypothetical protein J1N35_011864 [Gossypium stocksii]|uniref:UBN2 domain-containing protein n=1 Tax=Gossypium stocksii TaxID=47602 RepID=A0A9D3W3H4_9ROSI|nr:hypothetical protein J1N35_011864 [Gossypium stocksii]